MFIILPYRHDIAARRVPIITAALIGLNALVFLGTHVFMPGQTRDYEKEMTSLAERGVMLLSQKSSTEGDPFGFFFEIPELQQRANDPQAVLEYIRGKLVEKIAANDAAGNAASRPADDLDALDNLGRDNSADGGDEARAWVSDYDAWKARRGMLLVSRFGMIPARQPTAGLLTHMFIHAGWLHILFNMWFLYLAGTALEDRWGRPLYAGFYLLAGLAAALTHLALHPQSETPVVGASGAVAGLMGAFALRFAGQKVECVFAGWLFVKPVVRFFSAPAWALLGLWFAVQAFWALMYSGIGTEGDVAFMAHIGGFVFGLGWAAVFRLGRVEQAVIEPALAKRPEFQSFEQNPDLVMAMDMMGRENFSGALEKAENILRQSPGQQDARRVMAHALFALGRREESRAALLGLLEDARGRGERETLLSLYGEFRSNFPGEFPPPAALYAIGRALFEKGDAENADHVFKTLGDLLAENAAACGAKEADSDVAARALFYRARVRAELRGDVAGARNYAEKFLAAAPDHAWAARAREMIQPH